MFIFYQVLQAPNTTYKYWYMQIDLNVIFSLPVGFHKTKTLYIVQYNKLSIIKKLISNAWYKIINIFLY